MWQFRKQGQSRWYWKEFDAMGRLLRESAEYFRERIDCVVHAMRHGYIHPRQRALATRITLDRGESRAVAEARRAAQDRARRRR